VCDGYEWKNNWSPSIPREQCVKQIRFGIPKYKTKTASFCLPTIPCAPNIQARTKCKYGIVSFRTGIVKCEIESFLSAIAIAIAIKIIPR